MLEKNINWDLAAPFYDAYVRTDLDQAFFLNHARATGGPVLELMCGTGRITLPLIEAGYEVTGVDSCSGFVARLRTKLAERGLSAELVESDVREIDLGRRFPLVIVGFHSFSEILGRAERLSAMRCIERHLAEDGRVVITLYNPSARSKMVHQEWRSMGTFDVDGGARVEISSHWWLHEDGTRISGEQRYRPQPTGQEIVLPITFDLVTPDEMKGLAREVGLSVVDVRGDYEGAPFDEARSHYALFTIER